MPPEVHEPIIGLPDYKIISYQGTKTVEILAEYTGVIGCIHCGSVNLLENEDDPKIKNSITLKVVEKIIIKGN